MTYTIVWELVVAPDKEEPFEAAYASEDTWGELFSKAHGFIGTSLLRNAEQGDRVLTLDKWTSEAALIAFLDRFSDEYRTLDQRLEDLSLRESRIGAYNDQAVGRLQGNSPQADDVQ